MGRPKLATTTRRPKATISQVQHARIILEKLRHQCPLPEGVLFFAILSQAVQDAFLGRQEGERAKARRYLQGSVCMAHITLLGLDYDWLVIQLKRLEEHKHD